MVSVFSWNDVDVHATFNCDLGLKLNFSQGRKRLFLHLVVPVSFHDLDVQHNFCFDHDLFADSGQGHTQHQISLNFRARGT